MDSIIVDILLEREACRRASLKSWEGGDWKKSDKELPREEQSLIKDSEIIALDIIPEEIYKFWGQRLETIKKIEWKEQILYAYQW